MEEIWTERDRIRRNGTERSGKDRVRELDVADGEGGERLVIRENQLSCDELNDPFLDKLSLSL